MEEKHLFLCIDDYSDENIRFLADIYKYGSNNGINNYYLYIIDFFDNYGNEDENNCDKLDKFIESISCFNVNNNILIDLNESMYCDYSDYKRIEECHNVKIVYSDIISLKLFNKNFDVISSLNCLGYDEDGIYDWDEDSVYYFEKDILKAGKDSNKVIITGNNKMFENRFSKFLKEYSKDDISPIYVDTINKNKKIVGVLLSNSGIYDLSYENGFFNINRMVL